MLERLADLASEHAQLERDLSAPAIHADQERARSLGRRYSELTPIVAAYTEWLQVGDDERTAIELAESIARNGPLAVAATKRILAECRDWSLDEEFDRQREISVPVRQSADAREGALAFKEKRPPRWTST